MVTTSLTSQLDVYVKAGLVFSPPLTNTFNPFLLPRGDEKLLIQRESGS
jgi:hypothetical protein